MSPPLAKVSLRKSWRAIAWFAAGLVVAPFLATGVYRVTPWSADWTLLLPLVPVGVIAALIEAFKPRLRAAWIGLGVGVVAVMLFILWLFTEFGAGGDLG